MVKRTWSFNPVPTYQYILQLQFLGNKDFVISVDAECENHYKVL